MRTSHTAGAGILAALALLSTGTAAAAQDSAGWLAFAGCWVEVGAPADAPMTCVVPGDGGASLLTVHRSGEVDRERLSGDGVERPLETGGCEGVQSAELSADGARVYTSSRVTCESGSLRSTRGIMAMTAPDEWIQVRALDVGDGSASMVKRYRLAPRSRIAAAGVPELEEIGDGRALAIETARMAATGTPTVDDIIEASARTDAEAVRAWLVERGAPLRLDAERLVRMADAGVDPSVIDVAVAVSYPDRFAVARETDRRMRDRDRRDEWGRYDRYDRYTRYGRGYYDPFFYPYGYYGYDYYGYYGDAYGYGYGHSYGSRSYYGGGPTVIVVRPAGNDANGRAINGRGYTRGGTASTSSGSMRPADRSSARTGKGYTTSGSSGSSSSKGKAKPRGGGN